VAGDPEAPASCRALAGPGAVAAGSQGGPRSPSGELDLFFNPCWEALMPVVRELLPEDVLVLMLAFLEHQGLRISPGAVQARPCKDIMPLACSTRILLASAGMLSAYVATELLVRVSSHMQGWRDPSQNVNA